LACFEASGEELWVGAEGEREHKLTPVGQEAYLLNIRIMDCVQYRTNVSIFRSLVDIEIDLRFRAFRQGILNEVRQVLWDSSIPAKKDLSVSGDCDQYSVIIKQVRQCRRVMRVHISDADVGTNC
jgi:hypothetical protein